MEDNSKLIEPLLEKVEDYGKATLELLKLKALDKTSDLVSSILPGSFVLVMIVLFLLFLSLGLAFWLGDIFGKTYYGFMAVAGFFGIIAIVFRLFLTNWLKKIISNYIIKQVLK